MWLSLADEDPDPTMICAVENRTPISEGLRTSITITATLPGRACDFLCFSSLPVLDCGRSHRKTGRSWNKHVPIAKAPINVWLSNRRSGSLKSLIHTRILEFNHLLVLHYGVSCLIVTNTPAVGPPHKHIVANRLLTVLRTPL